MAQTEYNKLKKAEASYLKSIRDKEGAVKKKAGRPSKDKLILKALQENSTSFFKKVLDDETEEKLWWMFIEGRVPEIDKEGNQRMTEKGIPMFREISGISWNAFRQMVAYKRGMPSIVEPPKDSDAGRITVNFNVMGESNKSMNDRIREIQIPHQLTT